MNIPVTGVPSWSVNTSLSRRVERDEVDGRGELVAEVVRLVPEVDRRFDPVRDVHREQEVEADAVEAGTRVRVDGVERPVIGFEVLPGLHHPDAEADRGQLADADLSVLGEGGIGGREHEADDEDGACGVAGEGRHGNEGVGRTEGTGAAHSMTVSPSTM